MKSLCLFLVLFVSLVSIQAQDDDIVYVYGRSADVILKPKTYEDKSRIFLLNRYAGQQKRRSGNRR